MRAVIFAAASVVALAGCEKQLDAPTDRGVCWYLVQPAGGQPKFNVLARNQPDLEHCAGELEKMRVSFQALGAPQGDIVGAYQGQFLFLQSDGLFTSSTLKGFHYPFMVRTGDGRIAVPSAMPQEPEQK